MVELVRKKPFGLTVLMVFLGLLGAVGTPASFIMLSSLLGDGPFRVNGDLVTKAEFAGFLVPFMAFYLPVCGLAAVIAWSIHSEHPRSRPLLLLYALSTLGVLPLAITFGIPPAEAVQGSLPILFVPVLAWFYLYRKTSVVAYYDAIRLDHEEFP